ncbi:MAG: ABC-F family ATP-binding cassette domain-containing protein [Deltaproteobacteria bacterium]|nr:ABC-F family ATP-binding cassette domain-containing protein [Deltaproteobacteria bacterium]
MLNLIEVSKQYGSKILFEGASAFIGARSRIALIGPNGAGKTTLIRILLGQESPDTGRVSKTKHMAIGHLAQEVPKSSDRTVLEEAMRLDGRLEELTRARKELEAHFEVQGEVDEGKAAGHESDMERYGRVLEELEHLDEYRLEARAKEILTGMGFKPTDFCRKLTEFSGGWLMRVALSRVLLMDPDLLLLDEPTNHLDLESLLWLEEFLGAYQGAMLLVSHDRAFLNRMATSVLEIDQKKLTSYKGNIDSYVVQKEERLTILRGQYAGQQAKIAEIEAFVERFGAKATKARQAQSRLKQLDKMERIELPEARASVRFRFPPAPHSGKEVVTVKHAQMSYGSKVIFRDLDWIVPRGARVAIVGVNGAGKTTLLRLLAGSLAPTGGEVKLGHQVQVGYYAQLQAEALDLSKSIFEELRATAPDMGLTQIRAIGGAFLFSGDAIEKKIRVLSGGEKARVALAKLLLTPSNFLILDEPTNHLDVESRGILLDSLLEYEGTLCLISHDREFVGPLVDSVLEIEPAPDGSRVIPLLGSYDEYLARKVREAAQSVKKPSGAGVKSQPNSKAAAPEATTQPVKTGPSNNQRRAWEKERDKLESEIAQLEKKQAELHRLLADASTYEDKAKTLECVEAQASITSHMGQKLSRWEDLCALLE